MITRPQKIIIILICAGALFWMVPATVNTSRQHERRIKNDAAFLQIGRKVATNILNTSHIPNDIKELRARGVLSEAELRFFDDQKLFIALPLQLPMWIKSY